MNINPTQVSLQLRASEVTVEVYGAVAETTVRMSFYNPNPWRVGAELDFRLANGCSITGFGFEMPDGSMRRGVPINRLQRRLFLDDMVGAPKDISLIQELRDDYHKFRIFPIEAGETRTMEMRHIGDLLSFNADGTDLLYNMPLSWNMNDFSLNQPGLEAERPKVSFTFRVIVHGNQDTPYALDKNGEKLFFTKSGDMHLFEYIFDSRGAEPYNAVFDTVINLVVPGAGREGSRIQTADSGRYFYAVVNSGQLASLIQASDGPPPTRVGIAWDCSLSGMLRDHNKEFAFLDAYFERLFASKDVREVRVSLLRFRNDAEKIEEFVVDRSSGWEKLRRALASIAYDGATNFCAARAEMSLPVDEWLFFSGGQENYGLHSTPKGNSPVYAIASPPYAYPKKMEQFAAESGGVLIDLSQKSPEEAVALLRLPRARLLHMEGTDVADLLPSARAIGEGEIIVLAGRLTQNEGLAKLTFKSGGRGGGTAVLDIPVKAAVSSPLAAREWARMRTEALLANHVVTDISQVQSLGREFGVVSPGTALVIPPIDAASRAVIGIGGRDSHSPIGVVSREGTVGGDGGETLYPMDRLRAEWADMLDRVRNPGGSASVTIPPRGPFRETRPEFLWVDVLPRERQLSLIAYGDGSSYRERLRSVPQNKAYDVYLSEVVRYWTMPDFFLDTSNVLFEYGQTDLGLRVLSSLAEIDLENRWVLRTLAYRLMELGSPQGRVMFEKILKLDAEDPQSYRDLAMVCAQDGDIDQAVDLLKFVATHTWSKAYSGMQLAALRDISVVRAGQENRSTVDKIDPALLNFPPVDIRVMLAPDRYDAGLHLRLVDENGDVVKEGVLSFIYAPGRGTDELVLPKARSGKYSVQVGYVSSRPREKRIPVLGLVTVVTHAGMPLQNQWFRTVRLTPGQDGMTTVMEFDFDADRVVQYAAASKRASESDRNMMIAFGCLIVAGIAAVVFVAPGRR